MTSRDDDAPRRDSAPPDEDAAGDGEEWRFSVEDVSDDDGDEGSVFGPAPPDEVLEVDPGDPGLENAVVVALGVVVSLGLLAAVVGLI